MKSSNLYSVLSAALILAFALAAFMAAPAFADCPDGDGSANTLTCTDYDANNWTGGAGDDTMTQEDTSYVERAVSGGTGDDTIVINGEINENSAFGDAVYGDGVIGGAGAPGGDDTITINGDVEGDVLGDGMLNVVGSAGGDDIIIVGVNGAIDNNVTGDGILSWGDNSGGDDTIIIYGYVDDNVLGDGTISNYGESVGGNDLIIIYGEVEDDVLADGVYGDEGSFGGDDVVVVTGTGIVGGYIDGGDGTDTLKLIFIPQALLAPLDPEDDSITYDGKYFEWYDFESLIGQILAALDDTQSIIYLSGDLLGLDEGDGVKVFSNEGVVAFVPFADLAGMTTGGSLTYQQPNSGGWYVVVTDLGVNPANGGNHIYQISIYDAGGVLQGQFTVTN
jgi:hypothetical protein